MNGSTSGAAARAAAALAMHEVLYHGRNLDQALSHASADLQDRRATAQAQALAYDSLRWHCRHRVIIAALLNKPLRRRDRILESLLSIGLLELTANHAPAYAAVSANVAAARILDRPHATGLINATLRRFQRERDALIAGAIAEPEARYGYPTWLIDAIRRDWPSDWEQILASGQQRPPMWLRVNEMHGSRDDYAARLSATGQVAEPLQPLKQALRLQEAVAVSELPGFDTGDVSVQDAGAQIAAELLDPVPGTRVLDACAAPGGKTGHLLERCDGRLEVVAVDHDPDRLERVAANLARLQLSAELVAADLLQPDDWWDGRLFDSILLDVPCSASGVLRRHPDIRFLRRAADIPSLAGIQARMLATAWRLLRPGGRLLYATCSVLRAENNAVVAGFLADAAEAREPESAYARAGALGRSASPGHQLLPGAADTDGFYYALIDKQAA